jgi:hypothetical protein
MVVKTITLPSPLLTNEDIRNMLEEMNNDMKIMLNDVKDIKNIIQCNNDKYKNKCTYKDKHKYKGWEDLQFI